MPGGFHIIEDQQERAAACPMDVQTPPMGGGGGSVDKPINKDHNIKMETTSENNNDSENNNNVNDGKIHIFEEGVRIPEDGCDKKEQPAAFRVYTEEGEFSHVMRTYRDMIENQTSEFVLAQKEKYEKFPNMEMDIWKTMELLDTIVDESDPDNDLPQIVHAYQTAESLDGKSLDNFSIRWLFRDDEWEALPLKMQEYYSCNIKDFYFREAPKMKHCHPTNNAEQHEHPALVDNLDFGFLPLIGFIHDLGKVLLTKQFGELPQWAVVGDTFPVGQKLHSSYNYAYKNFHRDNKSLHRDTYPNKLGLSNIHMSWGHDEYLAEYVLTKKNRTNFPYEGLYLIRFHSFYTWHTPPKGQERGYTNLADDFDWYMLPLLKFFQKSDLYSKSRDIPDTAKVIEKYQKAVDRYFVNPKAVMW